MNNEFGIKIKTYVWKTGSTQNQLAEYLKISRNTLSRKIRQETEFTLSEIYKILEFFNCNFEDIFLT